LWREFPPAPDYFKTIYSMPREKLRALQSERFVRQIQRAWEIPFYQRHWGKVGIKRSDIRCLDDLKHLPAFSVHDLRDSIARRPPGAI
jgi:phenylacetate-CoA ligase